MLLVSILVVHAVVEILVVQFFVFAIYLPNLGTKPKHEVLIFHQQLSVSEHSFLIDAFPGVERSKYD